MSEGKVTMDHRYAREKLTALARDLDQYTADEFWRQMSRIAAGATGADHAEEIAMARDALCEQLRISRSEEMHLRERLRNLHILKAQWQAETLEKLYSESQGSMIINRGSLLDEARELRRQSEPDQ